MERGKGHPGGHLRARGKHCLNMGALPPWGQTWKQGGFSGVLCLVAQSCPTLCSPMDCSPPGSSVHGVLQARILEWVALPSSRGSSRILQGSALPSRESNLRLQHLPHCGPTESPGKPISQ